LYSHWAALLAAALMADGGCADGGWQMADGRWQMADGRWQMADGDAISATAIREAALSEAAYRPTDSKAGTTTRPGDPESAIGVRLVRHHN
jgi:hypothetical protein